MHRLTLNAWYSDAPYEARNEHPSLYTNRLQGHRVVPDGRYDLRVEWDHDDWGHSGYAEVRLLRSIELNGTSYTESLYVDLEDGETVECTRVSKAGTDELRVTPRGDGETRRVSLPDLRQITAGPKGGRDE